MSGTVADIADSCKACLTSGEKYQGATISLSSLLNRHMKDYERQIMSVREELVRVLQYNS